MKWKYEKALGVKHETKLDLAIKHIMKTFAKVKWLHETKTNQERYNNMSITINLMKRIMLIKRID